MTRAHCLHGSDQGEAVYSAEKTAGRAAGNAKKAAPEAALLEGSADSY